MQAAVTGISWQEDMRILCLAPPRPTAWVSSYIMAAVNISARTLQSSMNSEAMGNKRHKYLHLQVQKCSRIKVFILSAVKEPPKCASEQTERRDQMLPQWQVRRSTGPHFLIHCTRFRLTTSKRDHSPVWPPPESCHHRALTTSKAYGVGNTKEHILG